MNNELINSLARKLYISPKYILNALNNNEYTIHRIPKRKRGIRKLAEPSNELAIFHSFFLKRLGKFSYSECAYAYTKKKSIIQHAKKHLYANEIISFDIENFFGNISQKRVELLLRNLFLLTKDESELLSSLVCYNKCLPQGTKVSPMITNLYMLDFDNYFNEWAKENKIVYTRYSDDMYFSSKCGLNYNQIEDLVIKQLRKKNLKINKYKSTYMNKNYLKVTNLRIIDEQLRIPLKYKRKIASEFYYIEKFGLGIHMKKIGIEEKNNYLENLFGRIQYVKQVEPRLGAEFERKFNDLFSNEYNIYGNSFSVKKFVHIDV